MTRTGPASVRSCECRESSEMGSREKGAAETEELGEKKKVKAESFLLLVDRRGGAGPSTPPPTWRLELSPREGDDSVTHHSGPRASAVSARKLCAGLWEAQPYRNHGLSMSKRAAKSKGFDFDPPPSVPPDQPASEDGIREPKLASPIQLHKSNGNGSAIRPVSSASYCSSMEVAPYKPPGSPLSSLDWRGQSQPGSLSCSLRTSTELVKILNRIWSLEEQHASNTSLAKALKSELIRSQARIKELLRDKQEDKQTVQDMMKRVEEELEEERKLRKFSESERRKLAKELSVLKSGFSTALRELERERKARVLLESLCDEFAEGIRDYDQISRALKHKVAGESDGWKGPDRSILHISEAWLDERVQMKTERSSRDLSDKDTILDRLSPHIETFLRSKRGHLEPPKEPFGVPVIHQTRHKGNNRDLEQTAMMEKEERFSRRHSVESFPLNETGSAPKLAHEENSPSTDLTESSKRMINGNLNRSRSLSLKSDGVRNTRPESFIHRRGQLSPVRSWKFKLASPDFDLSEVKENTLMAKLLEARLESRGSHSRASRGSV